MRLLLAALSVATVSALSACTVSVLPITCEDTSNPCEPDASADAEPPPPTSIDAMPPPVRPDGGPDRPDGGPDARPDGGPDARPDTGPDSGPDAGDPCDNVVCNSVHGTSICVEGKCVIAQCDPGFDNCDGNAANGCEPLNTYFEDKDSDGHGVMDVTRDACTLPQGFATVADDCDDNDNRAFPGQTQYFSTPRASGGFDFNCDGNDSLQNTRIDPQQCICNGNECSLSRGWKDVVPSCGDSAQFAVGPVWPDACDIDYVAQAQSCR